MDREGVSFLSQLSPCVAWFADIPLGCPVHRLLEGDPCLDCVLWGMGQGEGMEYLREIRVKSFSKGSTYFVKVHYTDLWPAEKRP